MMPGTLYLLPNRISDTALEYSIPAGVRARAQHIRFFLVEAAKTARAYLKALQHPTPISELHIEEIGHDPDPAKIAHWLAPIFNGEDVAILSESGCPGIADPGAGIVAAAQKAGICVVPLTGPSSILLTLMASGLDGQRFRFVGYLPIHDEERRHAISQLEQQSRSSETQLMIETPYRNTTLLQALIAHLSETTLLCVATDVTGENESIRTLSVSQWKMRPAAERELPKLPTVFALLAAPGTSAPRYSPQGEAHRSAHKSPKASPQRRPLKKAGHSKKQ